MVSVHQQQVGDVVKFANGLLPICAWPNRRLGREELPARHISLQRTRVHTEQCIQDAADLKQIVNLC